MNPTVVLPLNFGRAALLYVPNFYLQAKSERSKVKAYVHLHFSPAAKCYAVQVSDTTKQH